MALTDRSQFFWLWDAKVGALNFASGAASSAVVTAAITTVLSTAGDGATAVPLRVFTSLQSGVITTGADNFANIANATTKKPIADATGNEVYGRVTEASGVYTLSYFSLINGVETPYTFAATTNIDFYFSYRYDAGSLPKNALIAVGSRLVQQDPSVATGSIIRPPERLNVTALNTLAALSFAPSAATNIFLIVNGITYNALGGANAAFSVSGVNITWNPDKAGSALQPINLQTGFEVIAFYW